MNETEFDAKQLPMLYGPSMAELQNMLEESLAHVFWDDGLEHIADIQEAVDRIDHTLSECLPSISSSLDRIASVFERQEHR